MYSPFQVCFVGEEAIDTGGPSQEYWRLLVEEVRNKYCCGNERCVFDRNTPALMVHILFHAVAELMHMLICVPILQRFEFRQVGTLIAMSTLQGGPGFPVLHPALYDYIAKGYYSLEDVSDSDVPDPCVQELLSQVHCVFVLITNVISRFN